MTARVAPVVKPDNNFQDKSSCPLNIKMTKAIKSLNIMFPYLFITRKRSYSRFSLWTPSIFARKAITGLFEVKSTKLALQLNYNPQVNVWKFDMLHSHQLLWPSHHESTISCIITTIPLSDPSWSWSWYLFPAASRRGARHTFHRSPVHYYDPSLKLNISFTFQNNLYECKFVILLAGCKMLITCYLLHFEMLGWSNVYVITTVATTRSSLCVINC